jgi:hypothetical protein
MFYASICWHFVHWNSHSSTAIKVIYWYYLPTETSALTMNSTCGTSIPNPPSTTKTSCAFHYPLNSTASAAAQQCCGQKATINLYDNDCFQYCDVSGNQSAMDTCLSNAGVPAACFTNQNASGANRISKPALSLAISVIVCLMVGAMRWPSEQISDMSWKRIRRDEDTPRRIKQWEREGELWFAFRNRWILIWNLSRLQSLFIQRGAKEIGSQMPHIDPMEAEHHYPWLLDTILCLQLEILEMIPEATRIIQFCQA